jgi:hypothetical protein
MKRSLIIALCCLFAAPAARGVINPEDNVIGPYFDTDADVDCIEEVDLNTQLPIHIILTRPTFGELYGFELGLDYGNNLILIGHEFANSQALNVGSGDDFIVGFGSPTYTDEATPLMTLSTLYMGTASSPCEFIIRGSQPSSLDPAYPTVLLSDGELLSTGLHSEYRPYTYLINGRCGFEDEGRSWDGVKTLYRR